MRLNSHALPRLNIRNTRKLFGVVRSQLTPDQVKAGTGTVRTYTDWENLFKSPEVGGKLGLSDFFVEKPQG
ncbi:hypothetical protein NIES4103_52070 [Nostoc sp. NIES-4103]|nr:hypothetical protein NIES4103_52070 [Nostoc sp. NIES-4103]